MFVLSYPIVCLVCACMCMYIYRYIHISTYTPIHACVSNRWPSSPCNRGRNASIVMPYLVGVLGLAVADVDAALKPKLLLRNSK